MPAPEAMLDTAQDRLERHLRTTGLLVSPALAIVVFALNPGGHPPEGRRLLAILVIAIGFWMTEAIPLPATALLATALAIVTGVAPASAVLAPYANPIIFLFIGTFLLAEAFHKYGLDRRVAGVMLRGRLGRSPGGLMAGFGIACASVSWSISNTATSALMTPIAVGAIRERGGVDAAGRARPWASGILLMIAYGASVGGMATLVGTPPNLLVAGFLHTMTGRRLTFTDWLLFGLPVASVLLVAALIWTRLSIPGTGSFGQEPEPATRPGNTPDTAERRRGALWTMIAFILAVSLWLLPGLSRMAFGSDAPVSVAITAHLPEAGVALLCAALLFVAPVRWRSRRFALTWTEGRQVNWGIILLFGGGLSLGTLAQTTGLAAWAGEGIQRSGLTDSPAGFLAVSILAAIVVSEFASNTAATTLLVPIVIAAAQASGFDPVRPALGVGLAATCGFIFPVSTPPNAIVFGTGMIPLWRMIRVGIVLDLTSFFVVWLGLLALTPLLPS